MSQVIVYNLGGHEQLNTVSLRQAVKMLHRGVARVHTALEDAWLGPWQVPAAIELLKYRFAKWLYDTERTIGWSKDGVRRRDKFRCAYCGNRGSTVDHIFPESRGGESSWLNTVTACTPCNGRKDNKTPKEAGMRLLFEPRVPTLKELLVR